MSDGPLPKPSQAQLDSCKIKSYNMSMPNRKPTQPPTPPEGDSPSLSPKEFLILQMLVANGEQYGLQMVRASEGQLKRGTIYVTLNRMEDKGFITSYKEDRPPDQAGMARRRYRITGLGEYVHRERGRAPVAGGRLRVQPA